MGKQGKQLRFNLKSTVYVHQPIGKIPQKMVSDGDTQVSTEMTVNKLRSLWDM